MLKRLSQVAFGGLVLTIVLAAAAAPARAQAPAEPAQPPAQPAQPAAEPEEEAEPATVLDEITVTAQKREENIQDVPVSVTSLDAEKIELLSSGGADVKFLSGRVPSLLLESSFGRAFPRFYIRGLGNTDFDLNASQPVSMIVDEVVLENPVVKGMPLWDLERTEVLRGPQGTLFGRNTPAGIVKFDTAKPSQERDGYVRASYGTFDTVDVKAAFGGALTETLSGRASVLYQSQSDWVDNTFTGENDALGGHETWAYRLQLLWEPSEDFSALLNIHGWDVGDGTARIFRANILTPGDDELVSDFEQDKVAQDGLNEQEISAQGGVLKMEWGIGETTLTSVTGYETLDMYSRGDIDGGFGCAFCGLPNGPGFVPFPAETADGIPDLDQFTQELRWASDTGGNWDWLFGFYYFDESLKIETFGFNSLAPGNPPSGEYNYQLQDALSWALFASMDFRPSDRWTLKAGMRYTTDEKDFSAARPTGPNPTLRPIVEKTDADLVTWDLSATYEASESVNLYGRVGTGFRAPSIQGRIGFCPSDTSGGTDPETDCVSVADEETIVSYEIGIKTEFDRRLRLNVGVYTYEVSDQQIVAVGGQANIATLLNADTTDGYGFEIDLDWMPSTNWLITVGTSYNSTEIDDPTLGVTPCGGGCTVLDPIVGGLAQIDGNSLPHAPEWIFNGIVDYRLPLSNEGLFVTSLDWAYHSEKSFFLYESEEFNGDSLEIGARIGYVFPEAKFELAAFARNLLDEEIVQNGIDFNNLTGMTNEPRQIGLEFVARF